MVDWSDGVGKELRIRFLYFICEFLNGRSFEGIIYEVDVMPESFHCSKVTIPL